MTATLPRRRKVKSDAASAPEVVDRHERAKNYLAPGETAQLLKAAKIGRHGTSDHLLLLMTYRHGLHVRVAITLRRDELDLDHARLWVRRLKAGLPIEQSVAGEICAPFAATSPPAPTRYPGCSPPSAASP